MQEMICKKEDGDSGGGGAIATAKRPASVKDIKSGKLRTGGGAKAAGGGGAGGGGKGGAGVKGRGGK